MVPHAKFVVTRDYSLRSGLHGRALDETRNAEHPLVILRVDAQESHTMGTVILHFAQDDISGRIITLLQRRWIRLLHILQFFRRIDIEKRA